MLQAQTKFVPNQRGFTLPELMIVIVLLGILAAIAIPSWFGLIQSRNVTTAANQIAADLRLTHSSAVNRLGTASVYFDDRNNNAGGNPTTVNCYRGSVQVSGVDYCLVRLTQEANNPATPADESKEITIRNLPDGISFGTGNTKQTAEISVSGVVSSANNRIDFKADGSTGATPGGTFVAVSGCPVGTPSGFPTIMVTTQDRGTNDPKQCITINPATSKVRVD